MTIVMFSSSDGALELKRKEVTWCCPGTQIKHILRVPSLSPCCGAQCEKQVGSQEQLLTQLENIHVESIQMRAASVDDPADTKNPYNTLK